MIDLEKIFELQTEYALTSIALIRIPGDASRVKIIVRDECFRSGRLVRKDSMLFKHPEILLDRMIKQLVSFRLRVKGIKL